MVKAAIFADNDDDVLDRGCGPDLLSCILGITPVLRTNILRKRKGSYGRAKQQTTGSLSASDVFDIAFSFCFFGCVERIVPIRRR